MAPRVRGVLLCLVVLGALTGLANWVALRAQSPYDAGVLVAGWPWLALFLGSVAVLALLLDRRR